MSSIQFPSFSFVSKTQAYVTHLTYPNPASDGVTVDYKIYDSNAKTNETYLKLVNDATGYAQDISIQATSGQKVMNLSGIKKGSYTILLYYGGKKVDSESLLIE